MKRFLIKNSYFMNNTRMFFVYATMLALAIFIFQRCNVDEKAIDETLLEFPRKSLEDIEYNVALKLCTTAGTNVKMIGFKTIHTDKDSKVDCVNYSSGWRRYYNWIGSDCSSAMMSGHCLNEE
jgi:hypothetical protein